MQVAEVAALPDIRAGLFTMYVPASSSWSEKLSASAAGSSRQVEYLAQMSSSTRALRLPHVPSRTGCSVHLRSRHQQCGDRDICFLLSSSLLLFCGFRCNDVLSQPRLPVLVRFKEGRLQTRPSGFIDGWIGAFHPARFRVFVHAVERTSLRIPPFCG